LVIDQAGGQDGWILAKFFFSFARLWTNLELGSINMLKKGEYQTILTEQAMVNKGFITWKINTIFSHI